MARVKSSSNDKKHPYMVRTYPFWRINPDKYTDAAHAYYEACWAERIKNERRLTVLNQ